MRTALALLVGTGTFVIASWVLVNTHKFDPTPKTIVPGRPCYFENGNMVKPPNLKILLQNGMVCAEVSPDDEKVWFAEAQKFADKHNQAVVVLQGENFVCLLNPKKVSR